MGRKLKVKSRPVTVDKMENDLMHCCRWCHWFDKGYCYNDSMLACLDPDEIEAEQEIEVIDASESFIDSLKKEGVIVDEKSEKTVRKYLEFLTRDILGVEVSGSIEIENPSEHYCREYY